MYLCSHCANERKWVNYNNSSTVSVAKGKWKRAKGISCHRTNIFLVLSQGEEKTFFRLMSSLVTLHISSCLPTYYKFSTKLIQLEIALQKIPCPSIQLSENESQST